MTAIEFAKNNGYAGAEYIGVYNGSKIYRPLLSNSGGHVGKIGYPIVIIEENGVPRLSSNKESIDILEWRNKKNG